MPVTKLLDPKDPQFKPGYQDEEYRKKAEGRWYKVDVDCGCPSLCYCRETLWTRQKPANENIIADSENWPIAPRPASKFDK